MRRPSEKMIEVLLRMEKRYEPTDDEYATVEGLADRGFIRQVNYGFSIWRKPCMKYHFVLTDLGRWVKGLLKETVNA